MKIMSSDSPAFPTREFYDEKEVGEIYGITKREYFAAKAMQGLIAANAYKFDAVIEYSLKYADALLVELG